MLPLDIVHADRGKVLELGCPLRHHSHPYLDSTSKPVSLHMFDHLLTLHSGPGSESSDVNGSGSHCRFYGGQGDISKGRHDQK